MKKIGMLLLVLLLALGGLGVGFAKWSEPLYINGTVNTGELDWEITNCSMLDTFAPPPYHPTETPDYTCHPGFEYDPVHGYYWQLDKNVGWGEQELVDSDDDGDNDTLEVTLHNAYPCYFNSVSFYVRNNGTIPLIIEKAVIDSTEIYSTPADPVQIDCTGDGYADVEILWGDHLGTQLEPGDPPVEISFWMHVLQEAPENADLHFTIELVGVQWNKYGEE